MPIDKEVGLGPGRIVLDGTQWGPSTQAAPPHFWPMPIVVKRPPISATAELMLYLNISRSSIVLNYTRV